ncbi:zinc ion binding, variant 2 [Dermatophagoides farinae]|uniref:Zinc ion binding, variant 2 n=1 Tax=Dermatophagoides farinae TaxID=6954 RepID=A0A922HVD4_DERFA|nr:zinc ion binding, variant 2 [Dermatophagoides farinae]
MYVQCCGSNLCEWILSDEEKRLIKEKILRNKIRKQQLESERKQQQRQQQNDNGRIDHQNVSSMNKKMTTTSSNGRRRRKNGSIKTENTTTVAAAVLMIKTQQLNHQENLIKFNHHHHHQHGNGNNTAIFNNQIIAGNNNHCNVVDTFGSTMLESSSSSLSITTTTMKYSSPASSSSFESSSSSSSSSSLSPDVCRMFTEPHAYSLDTLLTADGSDVFFDSCIDGGSNNGNNNNNNIGYDNFNHQHQPLRICSSYPNNFQKKSQLQAPIMATNDGVHSSIYPTSLFDNNKDYNDDNHSSLFHMDINNCHQKDLYRNNNHNHHYDDNGDIDDDYNDQLSAKINDDDHGVDVDPDLRFTSSSISSSLSDCCFLFSNSIDSIDFFDNDLIDNNFHIDSIMTTATSNNDDNDDKNCLRKQQQQPSTINNNNNNDYGNDTSTLMMMMPTTTTTILENSDYQTKTNTMMATFNNNNENISSTIDDDPNLPIPAAAAVAATTTTKTLILNELISDEFSPLTDIDIDDNGTKFASTSTMNGSKSSSFLSESFLKTKSNNYDGDGDIKMEQSSSSTSKLDDKINSSCNNDDDDDDDCVDGIIAVDTTITNKLSTCCNNENVIEDFSQYLLHDNDPPLTFQQKQKQQQQQQQQLNNSNTMMMISNSSSLSTDYCCLNSIQFNNNNSDTMMVSINDDNNYNRKENGNNYLRNYLTNTDTDDEMIEKNFTLYDYYPATELMPPPPPPPAPLSMPSSSKTLKSSFFKKQQQQQQQRQREQKNLQSSIPLLQKLSLSNDELYEPELYLIQELTTACLLLKNPYKRIQYSSLFTKNPKYPSHMPHDCGITEFFIHRLIRMSKRLGSFAKLMLDDQIELLKHNVLDMLLIRSVLLYDPDRKAFCLLDDKCKVSIMVDHEILRPCCIKYDYERHKNFPAKFKHEWKNDNIIFDLLTAITLFTPRLNTRQNKKIKDEYSRYTCLLRRYLQIKYGHGNDDAKNSFAILMSLIDEMRLLAEDVTQLFVRIYRVMHSFPLFMDLKFGANNELKNDSTLFNNIHNDSRYNNDEIITIANAINDNHHDIRLEMENIMMANNLAIESNICYMPTSANNQTLPSLSSSSSSSSFILTNNNNTNCNSLAGQISSSSSSLYEILNNGTTIDDDDSISMMIMSSNGNAGNHNHHHQNHSNNNNATNAYHECFLNSVI